MRLLGLPCARAPRPSSLFDVNHVGVGAGVLSSLSSTYRGVVHPWDPPRRAGPNGDTALRRMFQTRPPTGPLRAPLCCCCYGCVLFSRRSTLHSSDRGRCRACAKPYCLLRLPLCSLNHSVICCVVLSCASVASRSPLPLLCMRCRLLSALSSVHGGAVVLKDRVLRLHI